MNKIHIIYKTTHSNGKYYIGRHSTDNLDDGYLGSGLWPRSIKDKSTLTREILEYANDIESLKELEKQYLSEHFGKPNCMNLTSDSIGWDSENNPMKNSEIVARFSGDNHWSRKDPERFAEIFSDIQNKLVDDGSHIFQTDNPNKDGRNAKLAMKRGTHINLTENNPAKQCEYLTHYGSIV